MKDRLIQLLEKEKISSAEFADRIGVQRSNVSHILNGRNNPGFSFIQKVLETFPNVNPRWLITGDGSMVSSAQVTSKVIERDLFTAENQTSSKRIQDNLSNHLTISNEVVSEKLVQDQQIASNKKGKGKKMVRVLLFYDDNTFDDFYPTEK